MKFEIWNAKLDSGILLNVRPFLLWTIFVHKLILNPKYYFLQPDMWMF